jgi:hypothetical protein
LSFVGGMIGEWKHVVLLILIRKMDGGVKREWTKRDCR